jgi:UDP-N-acetylmuramoylalanine--D-glutamate ligase
VGARRGIARLEGAAVAVWGTGAEGRAALSLALAHRATVTVVADPDPAAGHPEPVDLPGVRTVEAPSVLGTRRFDVVVRSPGVSRYRPELAAAAARGALVTTLTALWLEDFADQPVLAVTGSKGKSTTAVLAAAALEATGRTVALAGNIGRPVAELYHQRPGQAPVDAYVLEVSSFQAADLTVSPPVGVLTLLAPDHLDWHGSYDRYVADKCNLFAHRPDMAVAVNATDPAAWAATGGLSGRIGYGAPGTAIAVARRGEPRPAAGGLPRALPAGADQVLVDGATYLSAEVLTASRLQLRGGHNLVNLCGALTAVRALVGCLPSPEALAAQLDRRDPLGSRLRTVGMVGGIELVDDALASNPAGTVAALGTFAGRPVCLVAGGADRGVDLAPLVAALRRHEPRAAVVVLGPAGRRLAAELAARPGPSVACQSARSVGDAVPLAVELLGSDAERGAVVLFSPGAPTPPAEGTYRERSAAFQEAAADLVRAGRGVAGPC